MKEFIKSRIFSFLLGAIIFSAITAYAGTLMNSNEVTFKPTNNKWNVTKVDEALNSLYSVAVPEEYSGTTEITPTYSDITLNTQDKLVKNNITISGIPSTYKNLTNTTTGISSDLANGKTLYNSDGSLITGTALLGSNCISDSKNKPANTQWNIDFGFTPSSFLLGYIESTGYYRFYFYNTNVNYQIFGYTVNTQAGAAMGNIMILENTTLKTNFSTTAPTYKEEITLHYIACK